MSDLDGWKCFKYNSCYKSKGKAIPLQAWTALHGFQEVEAHRFQDSRHTKVVMSALRTGRLYSPVNIPGTHFCWRLSQLQGHSAARRNMSMKNSSDMIGDRTRDLPVCSAVPGLWFLTLYNFHVYKWPIILFRCIMVHWPCSKFRQISCFQCQVRWTRCHYRWLVVTWPVIVRLPYENHAPTGDSCSSQEHSSRSALCLLIQKFWYTIGSNSCVISVYLI